MHRPPDRRVQKTRGLLHGALASLIHEKPYDGIVVKEILARANVGRSTFYAHFRDKEELLATGMRDGVRASAAAGVGRCRDDAERILRFSRPLLEHIGGFRRANASVADARRQAAVHERLRAALAEWVLEELRHTPSLARAATAIPLELLADHVASTFVLVLDAWLAREAEISAATASERFAALCLPVLRA